MPHKSNFEIYYVCTNKVSIIKPAGQESKQNIGDMQKLGALSHFFF